MGVYIKGMDMPKSCSDCELALHFDGYNENDCPFNAFSFYDCPFIELSTPHGRLIDADALMGDICSALNAMTRKGLRVDGEWVWEKLNDAIDNAPTVIEAEE